MTALTLKSMAPIGILAAIALIPFVPHASAQSGDPAASFNQLLESPPLSDAALSHLRGGFDIAPGVTAFFAFSRVVTQDGIIIQSILVPQTEISRAAPSPTILVTGAPSTKVSLGNTQVQTTPGISGDKTAAVTPQAQSGPLVITTSANGGQSAITSQLDSGGIAGNVTNSANNTAISVTTAISIATQGLPSFIQMQRQAGNMVANLQRNSAGIP